MCESAVLAGDRAAGQLVRKWTCVVRLSKRVKDLETELETLKKDGVARSGTVDGVGAGATGVCACAWDGCHRALTRLRFLCAQCDLIGCHAPQQSTRWLVIALQ